MAERTLNKDFAVDGVWFLPDQQARKIPGRFEFKSGRIELHLQEAFAPLRGDLRVGDPNHRYPELHGLTIEGQAVTLLDVHRTGLSIRFGSGGLCQPERCVARWAIFGGYGGAGTTFTKVRFRVPALQVWLARPAIHHEFAQGVQADVGRQTVHVLGLTKEVCTIPSIDATLEWQYGTHCNADQYTSVSMVISGWFALIPNSPQELDWYLRHHETIVAMLSLQAGSPMAVDCIVGVHTDELNPLNIVVSMSTPPQYCTHKDPTDFFLTKSALGDDWGKIVNRWFEVQEKVLEPRHLALSVLNSESLWLHVEFLSLMQALEGLHRALYDGLYMTDEAYEPVKKALGDAISAALSSDHKESLRSRIRYGNQISLSKRLAALVSDLSERSRQAILGVGRHVPRAWIDTRNYYTHWDEALKSNILDTQSMYNANLRMRHLLRILYVRLMGVTESAIEKALDANSTSNTAQELLHLNIAEQRRRNPEYAGGLVMTISHTSSPDADAHATE